MRYWGILAAKLVVAAGLLYGVWRGMEALYTPPAELAALESLALSPRSPLHDDGFLTICWCREFCS